MLSDLQPEPELSKSADSQLIILYQRLAVVTELIEQLEAYQSTPDILALSGALVTPVPQLSAQLLREPQRG
jgi:hypothetical protein